MLLNGLLAASLCMVAQPAFTKASAERDAEQVVCKSKAKTNTRFPKKICHTRAEWDQISSQHQREAQEEMSRPMTNPVCTGSGC
jgi:hypothetical protein